ncbi:hypothetical protein NSQ89_09125 [Niallia sp. FSL R7-0648]|jgi:hypothetical protein|uniref:hypothetical protein n=1 Tax=Niallia TaxID=2837506 RepID=UPI000BA747B0|nr:hypothetical protein [Niallia circulans]MCM2980220.1 hypothetical protein [Niallia circulans]PAE13779.1 hypothetical protein CHI02_02860 [Niallia circulans]
MNGMAFLMKNLPNTILLPLWIGPIHIKTIYQNINQYGNGLAKFTTEAIRVYSDNKKGGNNENSNRKYNRAI